MQSGTDIFGVANLAEAQLIRSVGRGWPILMLGAALPDELETALREEVMVTISTLEEAKQFSTAASKLRKRARMHIKVDTGLGRLGATPAQARKLIQQARRLPAIQLCGLYTHYSCAEDDADFSRRQRTRFQKLLRPLLRKGIFFDFIHANNSAALLLEHSSIFNTVRHGLLVYGIVPPGNRPIVSSLQTEVRPALAWKCRVSLVKKIRRGTPLSYGAAFIAPAPMRVATLTAGYGDGYLRSGSNRAQVLIGGQRCPILGRITMDQMIVDVSSLAEVQAGAEVVLIGRQGKQSINANDLAQWSGTVPWEILTNITYRVPRLYRGGSAA